MLISALPGGGRNVLLCQICSDTASGLHYGTVLFISKRSKHVILHTTDQAFFNRLCSFETRLFVMFEKPCEVSMLFMRFVLCFFCKSEVTFRELSFLFLGVTSCEGNLFGIMITRF